MQFSTQAANLTAELSSPATGQLGNQPAFSNRPATVADTKPQNADQGGVTVLLINSSHLAWPDLTSARQPMLRFLRALPANHRAAIYILKNNGFQILEEATADHALLAGEVGPVDAARARPGTRARGGTPHPSANGLCSSSIRPPVRERQQRQYA